MPVTLGDLLALRERGGEVAGLETDALADLAREGDERRCVAGELVLRAGDPAEGMFLVLDGRLAVVSRVAGGEQKAIAEIGPGGFVGEVALVVGGERTADVSALTDVRLLAVPRSAFESVRERHPDVWDRFASLVLERLRRLHLHDHLDRIFGPFSSAEDTVLHELDAAISIQTLRGGVTLFRQGDPGDCAYILLSGALRVVIEGADGNENAIGDLTPGAMVGEMALLTDDVRSASVFTLRESDVARIPRDDFMHLLEVWPRSLMNVTKIVIARLKQANTRTPRAASPRTIALIPAGPSVQIDALATELAASMARHGNIVRLSAAEVDAKLGRAGVANASETEPARIRLDQFLREQEIDHRYVLYQADPMWSPWTERCIRHADHVVVVAAADASPDPGPNERGMDGMWARGRGPRRSLVLLHAHASPRPRGTREWLDRREVETVYHARRDHGPDLQRLARILSGHALSLVLGGGGARGFAHLGVLRALNELDVAVDMVGGASIGAPIAGWIAQGLTPEAATAAAERAFHSLIDYTLPLSALLAGRRITASIERETGSWDIEDFWIPFFCVSTSLSSSRTVVHRRGNSARAIRASVAIPGILPPVPLDGELLVDGGVLNNLPVDVMRTLNPSGPVLAIDVVPLKGPGVRVDYGLSVSGWSLAAAKLAPWRKAPPVPALSNTVLRAMLVGAGRAREDVLDAGLADLYHNIRISGVGLLDFERVTKVAQIGYEAVIEPLRSWVETMRRSSAVGS